MFSNINNKSIVESLIEEITKNIKSADLLPGDKLPTEMELARAFGTSRTSVREAVKMLIAVGVLEIKRGDGTYVTKKIKNSILDRSVYELMYKQSSPDEIYELRKSIEENILSLAIKKATPENIEELKRNIKMSQSAYEASNSKQVYIHDMNFHKLLVAIADNQILGRISLSLYELFSSSIRLTLEKNIKMHTSGINNHHFSMLQAIIEKDLYSVSKIIDSSLEIWKENLKEPT